MSNVEMRPLIPKRKRYLIDMEGEKKGEHEILFQIFFDI